MLKVLRGLEAQGKREAAHRCAQFAARVFRYAIQNGYCSTNPAGDLRGALKPRKVVSHPGVTHPSGFALLMNCVDAPGIGYANVSNGLRLLARTALRPGELRMGEWSEVNFSKAEWRIPATRMKMKREHLVPLSRQAVAILREQQETTGDGPLIFPGVRSGRPMSDAAMGLALKIFIGPDMHVAHGFRVSFATIMHERGYESELIELQLSHRKRGAVRSVYDRSERVPERRALLQMWADFIDEVKKMRPMAAAPPLVVA